MNSGLIAINLAAVIFGTAALYGKLDVAPLWIVTVRAVFAACSVAALGWARGGLGPRPTRRHLRDLIVTGVILAFHWLTFFVSVQKAGVAIATLTFAAFPLFTVVLQTIRARRRPRFLELGAGLAIVVAIALMVDLDDFGHQTTGTLAGLASALAFAYFSVGAKALTTKLKPMMVSLIQYVVVAVTLAPGLFFASPAPSTPREWFCILLLGVVTTTVMHQLYLFALTKLSATTCSGFVALEPVYAIVFAAIFFGESLTPWVAVSGALVIGSSLVLLRSERSVALTI